MSLSKADEEAVFHAARRIEAADARRLYLRQACAQDPDFLNRVEALLRVHDEPRGFLESPPEGIGPREGNGVTVDHAIIEVSGTQIGQYKVLEQIGEGGMGLVYMAEQQHPVRRLVALKIVKPGMDSRQVIARFEAERQALAVLDHPNIAKVLDAGTTEAGRSYFVMELVKGVPITRYCDEQHLTIRQRLELFIPVCQAIQHAHQKGIIHRDIKPTNVLVALYDEVPVPKVIDFGVAKATAQRLTEKTMFTGFGQLVGTLEYMSPEHARFNQLDIDTRSDVYSLGVLLYELLTGSTPFEQSRLRAVAFDETLKIIREEEPLKPSTRLGTASTLPAIAARRSVAPAQLRRQVTVDLESIVMKCLEKDRAGRYETVRGLEMDLRRYLADEPVWARPPSRAYLARKFVRRNRGPVLSALLVLLALVGGIIGTTWGMIRTDHARQNAVSAQRAEAQRAAGERRAREEAQKRLAQLGRATDVLAGILRGLDPEAAEKDGVELHALLARRMSEAARQLEGEAVGDPLVVARLQHVLGISLQQLGHMKQAEAVLSKACGTRERLLGADHLDTAATKHHLAMLYRAQADHTSAERLLKEVVESRTNQLGRDDPETLHSQQQLALVYHSQKKFDPAESLGRKVLERRTATLGAEHPDTLTTQHRLALVYRSQGKLDLAATLCKDVLERRTARLGADHLDTLASRHVLAALYRQAGNFALAEPLLREVLELRTAKLGPEHPDTVGTRHQLALVYRSMERFDLSIPLLEETLRLRRAKLAPDHPATLETQADLGATYSDAGRFAEAIPLLEAVHRKVSGYHQPPRVGGTLLTAYTRAGRTAEATALAIERVRAAHDTFPADSTELAAALADVGEAYLGLNAGAAAEPLLRESLSVFERKAPNDWRPHHARSLLGGALLGQRKFAEAEPLLLEGCEGMRRWQPHLPRDGKVSATQPVERLVQLYDAWGKPEKAAQWRKALGERATGSGE